MPSLATVLLAGFLLGSSPRVDVEGCRPRIELDLALELSSQTRRGIAASVVSALLLEDRFYVAHGWMGIALDDELAVLVDLHLGTEPTSPDPARPDPRNVVAASLGVGFLGWSAIEL